MATLEVLTTQRGKALLIHENYLYNKDYTRDGITRWRCQNRACKGAVFFDSQSVVIKTVAHLHDEVPDKIEKARTAQSIRERAVSTTERANDIIMRHISDIQNDDTIHIMPHIATMRDSIRRIRNNILNYTPGVHQDIPESLKIDGKGNLFLRYDSGYSNSDRIVIFSSEYKTHYFSKIDALVIDGTFRSAPQGFYQILVIHGCLFGRTFPLVYILMSNKTERSYLDAFNQCKVLFQMNPKFIITDFEKALINSTSNSFNRSKSFGCLFHLGQAVWKRIGSLGLIHRYRNELNFKKLVKMML